MKLTKDEYTISRQTLDKVLKALSNNWFSWDEDDEYNNDDIIEAHEELEREVGQQNTHVYEEGSSVNPFKCGNCGKEFDDPVHQP